MTELAGAPAAVTGGARGIGLAVARSLAAEGLIVFIGARDLALGKAAAKSIGGPARARHLYALARAVQRHGRLFAVLESLDGGKPIRESRDIDIPLVARHFYHHAGWAQLQEREFADHVPVAAVLDAWTCTLIDQLDAVHLADLQRGPTS